MASGVILPWAQYGLPLDETTLAQTLHQANYYTAIVGKWHVGDTEPAYLPTARGFDYHYGLYIAIDHFTHMWLGGLDWHRDAKPLVEPGYDIDLESDDCVRIIQQHDYTQKPLFLYDATFAVHAFNQAPPKYADHYANAPTKERQMLLGMCEALDVQVGRIVDALDKSGQLNNTLVLFLSDNGGDLHHAASNGPLRAGKGEYYEGGVRIPAFAYWPGKITPGQTNDSLAYIADLYPTFAHLAGAPLPNKTMDGNDLAPVLFQTSRAAERKSISCSTILSGAIAVRSSNGPGNSIATR